MAARHTHYAAWALERFVKHFICYTLLLPLCLVLWPITLLGIWLGEAYNRLR